MTRSADRGLAGALDAFAEQSIALTNWLGDIPPDAFVVPSALPGWDARTLVAHVVLVRRGLVNRLDELSTERPIPAAEYVRLYQPARQQIGDSTRAVADELTLPQMIAELRETAPVRAKADVPPQACVVGGRGPITALDWAITRVVELVVHCDDFTRTMPDRGQVPLHRPALATAVRSLAEILAEQAPGRSAELRVPPFVAVQCIPGPRHKRGTPSNVVETDPVTWLRVATGRLSFAQAVTSGEIRASGSRADLSRYLPVLQ